MSSCTGCEHPYHECYECVTCDHGSNWRGVPNMNVKLLEIRDRATTISVLAIKPTHENDIEKFHFWRTGYGPDSWCIILVRLDTDKASHDPYAWDTLGRTMQEAHLYIQDHYDELEHGAVVDVEYILGETTTCKISERLNRW